MRRVILFCILCGCGPAARNSSDLFGPSRAPVTPDIFRDPPDGRPKPGDLPPPPEKKPKPGDLPPPPPDG